MREFLKSFMGLRPHPGAVTDIERFLKTGELKRFGIKPINTDGIPVFVAERHLQIPVDEGDMVDVFVEGQENSRRLLFWQALGINYRIPGSQEVHEDGVRVIYGDIHGNFEFTSALQPDQYLREFAQEIRLGHTFFGNRRNHS